MHALVLLCINQHTKFEVPSLTNYKIMIRAKFTKTGHMTLTTPILGMICHLRLGFDIVYLKLPSFHNTLVHSFRLLERWKNLTAN